MLPRDFITDDGFAHHGQGAAATCSPLIQGEDYPPYKDGLPQYVTLQERAGAQEAGRTLCGIVPRLFSAQLRTQRQPA